MPVERAVIYGMKRCHAVSEFIQENERKNGYMDARHRNEMGAWRCLMFSAGVPKDQLPEMPFLDPAHLDKWHQMQAERKKESAA